MSHVIENQHELVGLVKEAFSSTPISTRRATKALNAFTSFISNKDISSEILKNIYFCVMRGFTSADPYLKSYLYSVITMKCAEESFLAISSITKELGSDSEHKLKGKALLCLFVLVPSQMISDFEKFIVHGFVSKFENRRDAAVVCCLNSLFKKENNLSKNNSRSEVSSNVSKENKLIDTKEKLKSEDKSTKVFERGAKNIKKISGEDKNDVFSSETGKKLIVEYSPNFANNRDCIKKWIGGLNIIQKIPIKDYHSLTLLYYIKDRTFFEELDIKSFRGPSLMILLNILYKNSIEHFRNKAANIIKSADDICALETIKIVIEAGMFEFMPDVINRLKNMLRSSKRVVIFAALRICQRLVSNISNSNQETIYQIKKKKLFDLLRAAKSDVFESGIKDKNSNIQKKYDISSKCDQKILKESEINSLLDDIILTVENFSESAEKNTKDDIKIADLSVLNEDLENILNSNAKQNRIMAITCLLRTGNEETVDNLVNTIPDIVNELSFDNKIIVIDVLMNLCMKFENKEKIFIEFVKKSLQEKGNVDYKRRILKIVDFICCSKIYDAFIIYIKNHKLKMNMDAGTAHVSNINAYFYSKTPSIQMVEEFITKIPSFVNEILTILATYIEDPQSSILTMDILAILGSFAGFSREPKRIIVHILNRLILEQTQVRCAAMQSLLMITLVKRKDSDDLKRNLISVLEKYSNDEDDLVRDEANFILNSTLCLNENSNYSIASVLQNLKTGRKQEKNNLKESQLNKKTSFSGNVDIDQSKCISNELFGSMDPLLHASFDFSDLGNLKKDVLDALGEQEKMEPTIKPEAISTFIKECAELKLKSDGDFEIFVTKKIFFNKIVLAFRFLNKLEKCSFKKGRLIGLIKNNEIKEKFDFKINQFQREYSLEKTFRINSDVSISKDSHETVEQEDSVDYVFDFPLTINLNSSILFNSKFTYEIYAEEDEDEVEKESISLMPFEVSFLDFISKKSIMKKPSYQKKIEIKLQTQNGINDIKNLLNLRCKTETDAKINFEGEYKNETVNIEVLNENEKCAIIVKSSDDDIVKKIIEKLA
ncbi:hypothetical protein EDEG_00190 [Edhazardia aedis USNM 41457]|uniref:Coatomer subunit gamma n=1 Tax=Edhazardia aedis (strain USNM 41457) TaxID=1003232 RepID=J9DQV4_EDHAE|nr:hypothetical protein EDEG_00190 [Edhazardia aedis USNM 41457]|eukprot:EJW03702.1 hypothetical protein EDEG_00190 [Edhazardia aedis USNM 41457]